MTNLALQDLQDIFGDTTSQFPFDKFKNNLDKLIVENKLIPFLETRNKNGQLRKYKEYYFSIKIGSGNVLFGGNENSPYGKRFPTIRIYKSNRILQKIPLKFTFPSQNDQAPGRMCIIISPETIDVLFDIMQEEIKEYNINHEKQLLPKSKPMIETELMKKEEDIISDSSSVILFFIFFIIGVIIALISFFNLSLVGIIVGIIVFIIGCFFLPEQTEQTKKGISFEEARYYILGHGDPPNTNIKSKNGISKTRKRTTTNVRQTARTVNKFIRLFR